MEKLLTTLRYMTNQQICRHMSETGVWENKGQALSQRGANTLKRFVDQGFIEKLDRHAYRFKGLTGNADAHALAVTDALLSILIQHPTAQIHREVELPINRRPDAFVLLEDNGKHQAFFLEIELSTPLPAIQAKIRDYARGEEIRQWFEESFFKTENFCYHVRFHTDTHIPKTKGVVHVRIA